MSKYSRVVTSSVVVSDKVVTLDDLASRSKAAVSERRMCVVDSSVDLSDEDTGTVDSNVVQFVDTSHSVRGIGVGRVGGRSGDTLNDVVVGPGSGNNLDRIDGRDGREGSDGIDITVSDTGRKGGRKTLSVRKPEERVEEDARNGCSDEEAGRIEGRLDVVRETSPFHVRLEVLMDVLGAAKARLIGRSAIGTRPAFGRRIGKRERKRTTPRFREASELYSMMYLPLTTADCERGRRGGPQSGEAEVEDRSQR